MRSQLRPHKAMPKLFAFKGIIGLSVLQRFIINILVSTDVVNSSKIMTYHNITVGLPNLVLACEMPLFAIWLLFSYSASPYKNTKLATNQGHLKALAQALDLRDILSAFVRGPVRLLREQKGYGKANNIRLMNGPPSYENMESGIAGRDGHATVHSGA
ncbi:hypothetical protein K469DRAFT_55088 [Zopfia rhizophila CBS 207.26]|uniref:Uncharacterized protein n=1 Tax=Zopfia rhizophila CBS 207.26 TaxID=1314779 RepID=A0A6A6DBY9_9PEZI|nr:hypothetical protein K469DRAFT_55088 [Zopfia rhizophila CBS 207.26]